MLGCMAVMAREAWTDERLDDFRGEVNRRFDEVGKRFDRVEGGMQDMRTEMTTRFDAVDKRFDSMQRTIIICFSGMTASIVASIVGAILVTQL
jgi:hypothetical protein